MPFDASLILSLARKHGIEGTVQRLPATGVVNEAWSVGDGHVLRILLLDDADDEAERESIVVPIVRAAGIKTPALVAAKTHRDEESPPYTIYERAQGKLLGSETRKPSEYAALYRELGREIFFLNSIEVAPELIGKLREGSSFDADEHIQKASDANVISRTDAKDVLRTLAELDSMNGQSRTKRLLHQDLHPWNLFFDPATSELTAIIDWGDAAYGDPASEFASMPLAALPDMFAGYQEAGGHVDASFVARTCSLGIALALWESYSLDPSRFARPWWRLPAEGWQHMLREVDRILSLFAK